MIPGAQLSVFSMKYLHARTLFCPLPLVEFFPRRPWIEPSFTVLYQRSPSLSPVFSYLFLFSSLSLLEFLSFFYFITFAFFPSPAVARLPPPTSEDFFQLFPSSIPILEKHFSFLDISVSLWRFLTCSCFFFYLLMFFLSRPSPFCFHSSFFAPFLQSVSFTNLCHLLPSSNLRWRTLSPFSIKTLPLFLPSASSDCFTRKRTSHVCFLWSLFSPVSIAQRSPFPPP